MDNIFALRLISPAGFSRIEVPSNSTFADLKKAIALMVNVHPKDQKLFFDIGYQRPLAFADITPVLKFGLKEGDPIFLSNTSAELVTGICKSSSAEAQINKCTHSEKETCLNCIDQKKKDKVTVEEKKLTALEKQVEKSGLTLKCSHAVGQKCLHCMAPPAYKGELKYACQHGEGGKCPNCVGKAFISDAKHKSFDQFLNEKKEKCKGVHEVTSKCINCMPPQEMEFKLKLNCPDHAPYPGGVCIKCMPPNAILNRQVYRHVDYVSFMNKEEIDIFLAPWTKEYFMIQRMGFLYGYYAADPNYPDGIRAVVEAIYEPPQIGDTVSVEPFEDKDRFIVERVAAALSFECIGWIFTSLSEKGICMTSQDVRKSAKYQEEYSSVHPSGYKVSKFITIVVKPNTKNECEIEAYMVSDLCQRLERDNILEDSKDRNLMKVKQPKKNEMIASVYMEGKETRTFDPDFCIVNLGHGAPQKKKDMNILKSYDFPISSRTENGIVTDQMIRDYFKRHKKDSPLVKYANFNFLVYLAKVLDIGTAETYASQIACGVIEAEILDQIMSSILGYT